MKWVIVDPQYQPYGGGGNWAYVREFARAMAASGIEVHIICVTGRHEKVGLTSENGVTCHHLYCHSPGSGPLRLASRKVITQYLIKLYQNNQVDVINPNAACSINYNRLPKDIKVIHTLHAVISYEYSHTCWKILRSWLFDRRNIFQFLIYPFKILPCYFIEKGALRRANKIIVMSEYVKGTIKRFFPSMDSKKIIVSRIGVDPKFSPVSAEQKEVLRQKYQVSPNDTVFFTVRRLSYRMGLPNLIEAFKILLTKTSHQNVKLLIAGKGILKEKLERMVKVLGLTSQVKILGFVSDEALVEYYQLSDCFILPTEELEGFGIVSLEAMACNLPEIATPVGANPEILNKFHPELLTKEKNANAIYEKVNYFLENRERYENLENSRKVNAQYAWNAIVEEVKEVALCC